MLGLERKVADIFLIDMDIDVNERGFEVGSSLICGKFPIAAVSIHCQCYSP